MEAGRVNEMEVDGIEVEESLASAGSGYNQLGNLCSKKILRFCNLTHNYIYAS